MMKRLVLAAFVCLLAQPSYARVEQRQSGDGTARWIGSAGDTGTCVGGVTLQYPFFDTANIATMYQVSPITKAMIDNVYATSLGANTGTTTLRVWTGDNLSSISAVSFIDPLHPTFVTEAVIYLGANGAGTVFDISTVAEVGNGVVSPKTIVRRVHDMVERGETVVIAGDGGGTGNISAQVMVVLCPR